MNIYTHDKNDLLVIKTMVHQNFISLKFLIAISMMVFMIGSYGTATSVTSTVTAPINFVMNSDSFSWVDLTNDTYPNAFSYSYDISSTNTENLTLRIELYNNNTQVTYLYDIVNETVPIANNTVVNTINYNFTQSGLFSAKIYWFSQSNQILSYKEISNTEVVGLNGSVYNLRYKMWYNWQLVNDQSNIDLNFTVNFYFSDTYNVTFNYALNFHNTNFPQYDKLLTGTKQMSGTNDTFQNVNWLVPLNSGFYNVSLTWKDFLIYPLGNINRSINFNVDVPNYNSPAVDNGHFYHQGGYYNQNIHVSAFPVIIAFLFPIGVLIFVGIIVYRTNNKPPRHLIPNERNRPNGTQNLPQSRNDTLVASFCSNCGSKVIGSNDYCPNCGTKLDWD